MNKIIIENDLYLQLKPIVTSLLNDEEHKFSIQNLDNVILDNNGNINDLALLFYFYQNIVNAYLLNEFKDIEDYDTLFELMKINSLYMEHKCNFIKINDDNLINSLQSSYSLLSKFIPFMIKYKEMINNYNIPTTYSSSDIPIKFKLFDNCDVKIFNLDGILSAFKSYHVKNNFNKFFNQEGLFNFTYNLEDDEFNDFIDEPNNPISG